ncbi:MAG: NADH:ubiquinone reductase (Na(+)-transporting) subunit D [Sphaerochaeta sp.]|jgi:Na+-transporting NADH:ubiquinone oxidoreductase subunit D|nr:NADH:ubiquinone reductase (Na(+)-transporting) subunit D [Sphaerochaeta sp.]MDX9914589.1 NADH:ubiquinone reductase (Na(+)-transporting) subunit D [Sphaerochaeta sp.]
MAKSKLKKTFLEPLGKNNPVFVQILGICSTLAVTNKVQNTVVMTLGVTFTTALSAWTISLLRNYIPSRIRMMVETMIIAAFVIIVDIVLKAYYPEMWKQLGPYVGLIITNCIIMGRVEAFALNNKPLPSLVDGFSSGLGYTYVLLSIAVVRELLGSGSLWGVRILGSWWTNWSIMIMPPGGFFVLAIIIWIIRESIMKEASHA